MGDVSKKAEIERFVHEAAVALGRLDVLVNNAGVESIVPFLDIEEAEWERVTHINLKGEFLVAQAVVRRMIEHGHGGAIVNFGSVQAGMVLPGRTHYAPSERGVRIL